MSSFLAFVYICLSASTRTHEFQLPVQLVHLYTFAQMRKEIR